MNISTHDIKEEQSTKIQGRSKKIAVLSIIVGISGAVLVMAGGLATVGDTALSFLLSGLSILTPPVADLAAIALGLSLFLTAWGLWHLEMWALVLGLGVSLLQIVVSAYTLNITSFEFIRGVIVIVLLARFNRYFRMK